MNPKKVVTVCAVVVTSFVVAICGMNFMSEGDEEIVLKSYTSATQDYSRVTVDSVISQIKNDEAQSPSLPGISGTPSIEYDTSSWLSVCDSVHKQWGAAGFIYIYGGSGTLTEPNGNQVSVRTDCSGYVSYCLYVAGYSSSTQGFSSKSDYSAAGFTRIGNVSSTAELVPGDIVAWPGSHVQIYAGPNDDWYNWGSPSSCQNKYVNVTDLSSVDSQVHALEAHSLQNGIVYRAPQN